MAITLDGLVRNATATQKAGVPVSTKADLATGAFDLASKSVGQQVDATNVQLSPYGQVKSSFVAVQSAGSTLSTPAKSSTIEDITKAVQSFADAFNNATHLVDASGNLSGTLATASMNLKSMVSSAGNSADLKNIGININQDGTLSVDTNVLQNAAQTNPVFVQDTLAKVGTLAEQASQNVLNGDGTISPLGTRSKVLGSKATAQQKVSTGSQNAVKQQSATVGNNTASGIAAYTQMISR